MLIVNKSLNATVHAKQTEVRFLTIWDFLRFTPWEAS